MCQHSNSGWLRTLQAAPQPEVSPAPTSACPGSPSTSAGLHRLNLTTCPSE